MTVEYLGCYPDATLSASPVTVTTVAGCIENCNNDGYLQVLFAVLFLLTKCTYAYAGLTNQNECNCGDTVDNSLLSDQSQCSLACTNNIFEICGGTTQQSIYRAASSTLPLKHAHPH